MENRPKIVCLCGSTRFIDAFHRAEKEETLLGKIVLTIHVGGRELHDTPLKKELDTLHLHKIDLCDEILVLNVGGYIGESTKREIAYARMLGKRVRWLEHDIPAWKKVLNRIRRTLEK